MLKNVAALASVFFFPDDDRLYLENFREEVADI